ncbi:hypothetical protein D3C76_1314820 [compost metagenome]
MTVPAFAHSVQNLKPLHIGQTIIQHDHVRGGALGQADGTCSVVGNMDVQALGFQVRLDIAGKGLFVIDYQYCVHQGPLPEALLARFPDPAEVRPCRGLRMLRARRDTAQIAVLCR